MDKVLCSIDGSTNEDDVITGYSDGSLWNGWDNVALPLESIVEWLDNSPYSYHINEDKSVLVYFPDGEETFTPFTHEGNNLYDMNGYCFVILTTISTQFTTRLERSLND